VISIVATWSRANTNTDVDSAGMTNTTPGSTMLAIKLMTCANRKAGIKALTCTERQ